MGTLLVCAAYNTQKCCLFTTWPLLSYLPKSEEVFRLGLSDIQLLRCSYRVSVITQKARLCLQDLPLGLRFDFRLSYPSVPPRSPLGSASVPARFRLSHRSIPPRLPLCTLRSSLLGLRSSLLAPRSPLFTLRSSLSILYSVVSALHAPFPTAVWHGARHLPSNGAAEQRSGGARSRST